MNIPKRQQQAAAKALKSRPLRRKRRKARSPGLKGITLISSLLIAG
jgi:hypothetical protein